jgi:hypothetical protein
MATAPERMKALRERTRRGIRRFTIEVSENDLRTLAERGYEGAASADHDEQAKAVVLFVNDSLLEIWPTRSLSQRQREASLRVTCNVKTATRRSATVIPSHRRCGATAGAVTASLFGSSVVL